MYETPHPIGFSIVLQICTYFINFANFVFISKFINISDELKLVSQIYHYLVNLFQYCLCVLICY